MSRIAEIADGRTDLVFEHLAEGHSARATDRDGVSLIQWCSYYGDVSAIKFLLANGESIQSLGDNLGLAGACFHGHWRLCKFLIEQGAKVNLQGPGESPLHSALCTTNRGNHNLVLKILLAHGANPNCVTKESAETGSFMRDCRTKGETPLHRAAAFGDEEAIQLLLDAGAGDRRQGYEWRFSADLGQLAFAASLYSQKTLLRRFQGSFRLPGYAS